jgi:hypothetical protein
MMMMQKPSVIERVTNPFAPEASVHRILASRTDCAARLARKGQAEATRSKVAVSRLTRQKMRPTTKILAEIRRRVRD